MKERLLDVIKWGLILIIAGAVFYVVFPKYDIKLTTNIGLVHRINNITGVIDTFVLGAGKWEKVSEWETSKDASK